MTIQQLQIRYQRALENRRNTREAVRLANELLEEAEAAHDAAFAELEDALKGAFNGPIDGLLSA